MASHGGELYRANENGGATTTYNAIMGFDTAKSFDDSSKAIPLTEVDRGKAVTALSNRLTAFRKWLTQVAGATVHPALCIVNGEATDGTKNAPVLVFDKSQLAGSGASTNGSGAVAAAAVEANTGAIDGGLDRSLYDRTMGCQIRATRELKKDEVIMTMPRHAMITPDLVAASDAGEAIRACITTNNSGISRESFWDVFENSTLCESAFQQKIAGNSGPQMLIKILKERQRAETVFKKAMLERQGWMEKGQPKKSYSPLKGTISTRAPLFAFLIHQRFYPALEPLVSTSENSADRRPSGSPQTYAPYVRTFPSFVSLPLCWKRSELALLTATPGLSLLIDVAVKTFQLAAEFTALLETGILERFPDVFPDGLLTWDRWVWAAAMVSSRILPATCYMDAGVKDAADFKPEDPLEFQSPAQIWMELGVMVPLLDMLNHESDANQVTWQPCVSSAKNGNMKDDDSGSPAEAATDHHPPRAIVHQKVRKGSELYCCYATLSNQNLILQYGFAQFANTADEVKVGWSLADSVGYLESPEDYVSPVEVEDYIKKFLVFDTTPDKQEDIDKWWTSDRLELLQKEAFSVSGEGFMDQLKKGKKITAVAYGEGVYHPILLSALVVATMPKIELQKFISTKQSKVVLSVRHQLVLRSFIAFFFSRKMEKLLQNVSAGLKDQFGKEKIWVKTSKGGLKFQSEEGKEYTGWQTFFDAHAYKATMEVESHYYAMGADSCVLALYDGQLRALQLSIDGVCSDEKFTGGLLRQLEDLGYEIGTEKDDSSTQANSTSSPQKSPKRGNKKNRNRQSVGSGQSISNTNGSNASSDNIDKQPAMKLHVGNLSFGTTPSLMYDYFSSLYGRDNILECHIPIERETGRSRGFGFVTLPSAVAQRVLDSGTKHELDGRLVKVAKSNSAGTSASGGVKPAVRGPDERCNVCGYRPKYCRCAKAASTSFGPPQHHHHHHHSAPPFDHFPRRSNEPRYLDRYDRNGDYRRDYGSDSFYDRDDDRYRDRYGREGHRGGTHAERSRSNDRGDGNYHDRSRRGQSASYDSRGSGRRSDHDSGRNYVSTAKGARSDEPWGDDRRRSRSRSRERSRSKKAKRRRRSRSRSTSLPRGGSK